MNRSKSLRFAAIAGFFAAAWGAPAASHAQTTFYAADAGTEEIGEYNATTGAAVPGFTDPSGAYWGSLTLSSNIIYAANASTSSIDEFDATTGSLIMAGFITGLDNPGGLTISGNTLYVANVSSDPSTSSIGAFNLSTGLALSGFTDPYGLDRFSSVAVVGGNLLAGSVDDGNISEWNASTGALESSDFITAGGGVDPGSMAVSGNDLFIADGGNGGEVGEYDATTGLAVPGQTSPSGLNGPIGLALSGGDLYVGNNYGQSIDAYDATTGAPVSGQTSPSGLSYVDGIAFASVPEPGTVASMVLGGGILVMATMMRRKKRFAV